VNEEDPDWRRRKVHEDGVVVERGWVAGDGEAGGGWKRKM